MSGVSVEARGVAQPQQHADRLQDGSFSLRVVPYEKLRARYGCQFETLETAEVVQLELREHRPEWFAPADLWLSAFRFPEQPLCSLAQ